MKSTIKLIVFIFLTLSVASCNQYTKEDYLTNYRDFINEIKEEWKTYDDEDWKKLEIQNQSFFVKDKYEFMAELSPAEQVRIHRYNFLFNFYKGDISLMKLVKGDYNKIFKGLGLNVAEVISELKKFRSDLNNESTPVIINRLLQ